MVTLEDKLNSVSRKKLADMAMDSSARNIAAYCKMLMDELGKERAAEVIYKHRFEEFLKVGQENAKRSGKKNQGFGGPF